MRFDKRSKIEKAASSEDFPYASTSVRFEPDKSRLIATDGRILAIVPCEPEPDDAAGQIQPQAFATARKLTPRHSEPRIGANSKIEFVDGSTLPRLEDVRFPEVDGVVPTGKASVTFGLNVALLSRLAAALGTETVRIEFVDDGLPLRVSPIEGVPGARGLIMPLKEH